MVKKMGILSLQKLHESLVMGQSAQERLILLDTFVKQLEKNSLLHKNKLINYIMNGLWRNISLQKLSTQTSYSRRQLQRVLSQHTGYTPITFSRIFRFQKSLQYQKSFLLNERYYDQSHFIKDFKTITGYTPTTFYSLY